MNRVFWQLKTFFIPTEENHFRPKSLESGSFLAYIVIALVLKLGFMSLFTVLPKTLFFADVASSALVALTNEARTIKGLSPLQENSVLALAAGQKARDLLQKGYFAHESPDGKTPWYWFSQAGYRYTYAGENLAIDFVESTDVVQAWLDSPGHRANIENANYKDIGIAVVSGKFGGDASGDDRIVVVQLFGKPVAQATATPAPRPVSPKPSQTPVRSLPILSPTLPEEQNESRSQSDRGSSTEVGGSSISQPSPSGSGEIGTSPTLTLTPAPGAEPPSVAGTRKEPELPNATVEPNAQAYDDVSATRGLAATTPQSDAVAAGQAPSPSQKKPAPFYASAMTVVERFSENIFFVFLAFVIATGLLNIFIRRDIQHPDLIARAFVLIIFFLTLVAVRNQTFLHLIPRIL